MQVFRLLLLTLRAFIFSKTLWATAAAGAPCSGMIWYWHDYVETKNLYSKFAGIKAFMANTAIATKSYANATVSATTTTNTDLTINPINWEYNDWSTQPNAHTITGNGSNIPSELICTYLRNPWGATNKNPVFTVNYPVASTFVIRTGADVNAGAVISVKIDANAAQKYQCNYKYDLYSYCTRWKSYNYFKCSNE